MKRTYIFLILCILSIPYFTSCKQKTIKTVEKNVSQKYYLSSDTTKGKINIDINVEIPVCYDNEIVLDLIRKEIISNLFGDNYINIPIDSVVQKFAVDLITEYKLNNGPLLEQMDSTSLYSFNNEHVLEGFSLLNDEKIYSYGINRYVFMGGAHGLSNVNYFNFDLRTGKKITEKELFKDDYATKLSELIKVRIVEQSVEDQESDTILNLEDTDFWVDAIKPNENFYITDESINYVFNPYEIAPYYMGQTEVVIPFYRLKDILKPNSIISYLTDKEANK
ncbi:MAG: RsiV family protein [Paludibacter sp.]